MVIVKFTEYGDVYSDWQVEGHCQWILECWAKDTTGECWVDNISQFVVWDVYRAMLLDNPELQQFVKFYIDDQELLFNDKMTSNNLGIELGVVWERAINTIAGWRRFDGK